MSKVIVTETLCKLTHTAMKILGPYGQLRRGSKWAPFESHVEYHHRWQVIETIYSGTNEIQRNIMAQRGLGLPQS